MCSLTPGSNKAVWAKGQGMSLTVSGCGCPENGDPPNKFYKSIWPWAWPPDLLGYCDIP